MVRHAVATYPNEACGILLSHSKRPQHITEVHPTKNATLENPTTRYFVDPLEFLKVDEWAEDKGLDICGFYHSHPDHSPVPSENDLELAWEGYLYLIVSIKVRRFVEARAWIYDQDAGYFKEVTLQSYPLPSNQGLPKLGAGEK
jgi:proteasome lid subunit RPN8/RPN11